MRIDRHLASQLYENIKADGKKAKERPAAASDAPKTDKVQISQRAMQMSEARSLSASLRAELTAEVSPERLDALRAAIANGEYHVDAELIAGAMLKGTE